MTPSWQSSSIHPPLPPISHGMVWYGLVWYAKVWDGMVWCCMGWYCMVWPAISHGHQKGETWAYRPTWSVQCKHIFIH